MNDDSLPTLSEECGIELYEPGISRITKDTIFKIDFRCINGASTEALTLDIIARHTTIPVPRVRRVIPMTPWLDKVAIIMDYIPGRQLVHVWPTMSFWAKLRVAFILRGYVRQLRAIRHPRSSIPGAIAPGDEARNLLCPMMLGQLSIPRSPCPAYADLSAWFNNRFALSVKKAPHFHVGFPPEPFDDSQPLVLTHCDLNMRNILIGDDGKVYLIDWAYSGFYPPWFEYVNWRYWLWQGFSAEAAEVDRTDYLWNLLIPIITHGPFFRQERWYLRILPTLFLHRLEFSLSPVIPHSSHLHT